MARATSKIALVDFHSHCLPGIDDGARDVETACAMLRKASEQGAAAVVATPHFYWGEHTVDSFLQARRAAVEQLRPHMDRLPPVRLGAEVLLREHISHMDLRPLCLEGTDVLLVELPFMRPPAWVMEELENIAYNQRLTVMLAHLDRYMPWYSSERIGQFLDLPDVIVQLNAETIAYRGAFRALQKWLPDCERMVLGSDMHDLDRRGPELDAAMKMLNKKRQGRVWLERMQCTADLLEPQ
ncbi:MAG: hypothetical protein IIX28_02525 [Clostridia bacterium]|nr:hypothetical protein [Clostridia bacterium]